MKPEQITETLEQAAAHLGIKVRYETMTGDTAGAGGLCKLKGAWCVIIDRKTPSADRAAILIEALTKFDTDGVYLPPQLRDALAARRAQAVAHDSGQEVADQPASETASEAGSDGVSAAP